MLTTANDASTLAPVKAWVPGPVSGRAGARFSRVFVRWSLLTALTVPGAGAAEEGAPAPSSAPAPATSAGEEELSFDQVQEAPPTPAATFKHWYDLIHLSGRFDLNYELDNPAIHFQANPELVDETTGEPLPAADRGKLKNYHHFLFLKATPTEQLTLEAELVDLSYYELKYKVSPSLDVRIGKILVPFGSSPFHHFYGARQGNPFVGLLVPNFWAELGGAASYSLLRAGPATLEGDTYLIRGFDGTPGNVLTLNVGGSDTHFAIGQRLKLGIGTKASFWASAQFNRWRATNEGRVLLWGLDGRLDYGLIPLPVLKDFSLKAAFARAEVRDLALDPALNPEGWYWRYGDYVELAYGGLRPWTTLRLRYGTIIDYNQVVSEKDVHNWTLAAQVPLQEHLSVLFEYQWNMEEINEIDNDLLRVQAALEF